LWQFLNKRAEFRAESCTRRRHYARRLVRASETKEIKKTSGFN
jgi:hypothetical protein